MDNQEQFRLLYELLAKQDERAEENKIEYLRDSFAMAALPALIDIANRDNVVSTDGIKTVPEAICAATYEYADLMLIARTNNDKR